MNKNSFRPSATLCGVVIAAVVFLTPSLLPPWRCFLLQAEEVQYQPLDAQAAPNPPSAWYDHISTEWGGHLKAMGSASWPDDRSCFQYVGTRTYYDGGLDFRLKNKLFFTTQSHLETHYEAILYGGDTRRKTQELQTRYPVLMSRGVVSPTAINDDRRLMNLTNMVKEDNSYLIYQRLDRLVLTALPDWGTVKLGRQALTWGNGLRFNPMDLFNPFAPTDVIRDYKIGDDMVNIAFSATDAYDLQGLYVPRRDPVSGDVEWGQSSLAGKIHFSSGTTEFDLMAASHYQDYIAGIGSLGYWGSAAWRLDVIWTDLNGDHSTEDYLSFVTNVDYSWVWFEKNMYGLIEYFYNGLGETDYPRAFANPDLSARLERGELFTLGRNYLGAEIQLEVHPLLNTYLSVITNLDDPSGIIQPRIIWDMQTDIQATLGANLYYGGSNSEYGGFAVPGTSCWYAPADSVYLWLTYYF